MSVQTEIDRIITAVEAAHVKVAEKGGTTARPYLVANLESAIASIPEAANPVLQEKTISPSTSSQDVTPDSGYDGLSRVTVNAMPTATQATPSISVSSGGLITAKSTQTAGYVAAGTKSATKQLTVQAAQTITPGTADKTIASGRYLTGTQTIKGDANLVAANIAAGVSIFGVTGTHAGGSGDSSASVETCTVRVEEDECHPTYVGYVALVNGETVVQAGVNCYGGKVLNNVVCGSMINVLVDTGYAQYEEGMINIEGGTTIVDERLFNYGTIINAVLTAPTTAGATGKIIVPPPYM